MHIPDCAAKDADFELVGEENKGEEDFPFFQDLCVAGSQESD